MILACDSFLFLFGETFYMEVVKTMVNAKVETIIAQLTRACIPNTTLG